MKKQNKQTEKFKKITVIFGYSLFALLLTAVTLSTIVPMGVYFFNPVVRHFNAAIFLISMVTGAILPPLMSYFIGDRATLSKSKLDHHFNGVLFGATSYWLSLFFFFIGSDVISKIRSIYTEPLATAIAGWPVLATLLVVTAVAVGYVKQKRQQTSVMQYQPFQFVLFGAVIASFSYIIPHQSYETASAWIVAGLYIVIPVGLIAIAYKLLPVEKHSSTLTRLVAAVIATTLGFVASSTVGQLPLNIFNNNMTAPISAGIGAYIFYLWFVCRKK